MSLASALKDWLPSGVHFGVSDPKQHYPLLGSERAAVENAIEKRQTEFSAGRAAARQALISLGQEPCEIPVGHRRAPQWPAGVCGAITHSKSICIAIVAQHRSFRALGIDAEPDIPLKDALRSAILHESESDVSAEEAIALFSMKEALFKTMFPITQEWMGFHAAKRVCENQLELTKSFGEFSAGHRFDVPTLKVAGHVISFCSLKGGDND